MALRQNVKQNSVIVSLLCLELDEVAVDHIQETFGNLILSLFESTKLVCLFGYILLCSNLLVLSFRKRGSSSAFILRLYNLSKWFKFWLILFAYSSFYTIYQINQQRIETRHHSTRISIQYRMERITLK